MLPSMRFRPGKLEHLENLFSYRSYMTPHVDHKSFKTHKEQVYDRNHGQHTIMPLGNYGWSNEEEPSTSRLHSAVNPTHNPAMQCKRKDPSEG